MSVTRRATRFLAVILLFAIAGAASAHHPPNMERCASFSFSGQIERIEWRGPHVELFIQTDDGTTYGVAWLDIHQLRLAGIHRDTLSVGDEVEVAAGIRPDEVVERPMLLSYIHRESDGWGWSQVPQGC